MKKETFFRRFCFLLFFIPVVLLSACHPGKAVTKTTETGRFLSKPLVTHIYTADPSAHVFNNTIYIYPSHDIESGIPEDDIGSHFAMRDYHILSTNSPEGK